MPSVTISAAAAAATDGDGGGGDFFSYMPASVANAEHTTSDLDGHRGSMHEVSMTLSRSVDMEKRAGSSSFAGRITEEWGRSEAKCPAGYYCPSGGADSAMPCGGVHLYCPENSLIHSPCFLERFAGTSAPQTLRVTWRIRQRT